MTAWIESLSPDARIALWTILVATCCSVMCALLGVWLVLQRMSMVGDAISHAVLPGLVLVFLAFGTRAPLPMMLGAAAAGLLTVLLTRALTGLVKVREDASLGVVFTLLFAVGVVLITRYAAQIDLDPGCVLYGLIEFVALDTRPVGGLEVPSALVTLLPSLLVVLLFLFFFRKPLAIMAFDAPLARALGQRPGLMYGLLMAMVAIATVASFESVGAILVIAMLIGPAATAQLLSRRLAPTFAWSAAIAVVASVLGYMLAVRWNTSVAGMIASVIGAIYAVTLLASPTDGLVATSVRRARLAHAVKGK